MFKIEDKVVVTQGSETGTEGTIIQLYSFLDDNYYLLDAVSGIIFNEDYLELVTEIEISDDEFYSMFG